MNSPFLPAVTALESARKPSGIAALVRKKLVSRTSASQRAVRVYQFEAWRQLERDRRSSDLWK
jgi:hypothetical protein